MNRRIQSQVLVLLAVSAIAMTGTARAQGRLDELARYGGSYSTDCANPHAARVRILPTGIVLERDSRRMQSGGVQPVYSTFGNTEPPQGFEVEFMSDRLDFHVYRDRLGLYVEDGGSHPDAQAILAGDRRKLRDCDSAKRRKPEIPTAPPSAAPGSQEPIGSSWQLMASDPRFKRAYHAALGAYRKVSWLADMGQNTDFGTTRIGNVEYLVVGACQPHNCADNHVRTLYDRARGTVYGAVYLEGRPPHAIGNPPSGVMAELHRLEAKDQARLYGRPR